MEVEIEYRPVPVPVPTEVLVKVMAVGVCGSDVHYYESGRIGSFVVENPMILGTRMFRNYSSSWRKMSPVLKWGTGLLLNRGNLRQM